MSKQRMKRSFLTAIAFAVFAAGAGFPAAAAPAADPTIAVDCDFPGGNIVVDSLEGTTVSIHQDLRDTEGDWFYWCFRVRGGAGRTLTFQFTKSNVIGVRGPAVSVDGGKTWAYAGRDIVSGKLFRYAVPENAEDVRFGMTIPYQAADLQAFLNRYAEHPHLELDSLCKTRKGRNVELLRLGRLDGKCRHRVVLTCRHHACETIASYTLEGLMAAVLDDTDDGRWLRANVEFLIVPFMDKDGVEDGDQGKNRRPHDHNRDYHGESLYPSVRKLKPLVRAWSEGRLRVTLDLHCPYIRGENNEWVYFVGGPDEEIWARVGEFSKTLEAVQSGPIVYRTAHNLPFGQAWNTMEGPPRSCSRWMATLPGVLVASTIEIPYANANGTEVTPAAARALGRDLARALRQYLQTLKP
jgi:hypothetical protein